VRWLLLRLFCSPFLTLCPFSGNLDGINLFNRALSDTEIWQQRCPTETEPLNCRGLMLWLPFERNALDASGSGWHATVPHGMTQASPYVRGAVGRFALSLGE
jgi:hypothetical protein